MSVKKVKDKENSRKFDVNCITSDNALLILKTLVSEDKKI